jgi:4a-hydroxytetrahydrobiopterin dehydratase
MWKEEDNMLKAKFRFRDFSQAFAFMTEVAILAEKQNHHPNWSNVWNTVDIHLTTHDAGNTVTDRDRKLAASIDSVFEHYKNQDQ